MLGAVRPSTVRANMSPMTANCTRLRASHCTLAPRSSITTSPRAEGPIAAIAGRSMPGSVFSTILASAIRAPVFPAETTPAASPAETASIASRIEACRMRSAAVGFMSLAITSGASRTVQAAAAFGCSRAAARGGPRRRSPGSGARGCRSAATASPAMTMSGARSPPIASTARENGTSGVGAFTTRPPASRSERTVRRGRRS